MKKIMTVAAIGAVFVSSEALASGFNLREQSVAALGNAFTGATAGADDISYSYFNPAGLTRHGGVNVNAGGTLVAPRSRAKRAEAGIPNNPLDPSAGTHPSTSGYTDNIVREAVLPAAYASTQINDRLTAGISFNVPYGMVTKYDDDWAGRMHGTLSKVETYTLTPMLAYKLTCDLSIGAGVQMQHINARLRNRVALGGMSEDRAALEGEATDFGYTLGALYELSPSTRFGVGYRSQISHKLKGNIRFDTSTIRNQDIHARLTTPANLTVGAYHDIDEKWAVMAEFGRTYWSSFQDLVIYGEKSGLMNWTEEKWKDTTFYGVGATYTFDDQWKFRGGIAVDQAAVGRHYRTPRIPDSDRIWFSSGAEYAYSENVTFNIGYTYIRAEKGKVDLEHSGYDKSRGYLRADYENDVHILGIGFNYNF